MGAEIGSDEKHLVFSVEHCDTCDISNKRAFVKGDYILKQSGKCPKCGRDMTISAIYAEPMPNQGR